MWPSDVSEDSIERFAQDLRELREAKGWSQRRLAAQAHFVPESISAAERGQRIPTEQVVGGYLQALGASPAEVQRWKQRCRQLRVREGYKPAGHKRPPSHRATAASATPAGHRRTSDDPSTQSPATDTEQADTEQADTEQADTEQADTEQADTEQADTEQADTEQADT
ncbi:helix-turn-helix domain-containing protein, partial [Kineococcus arenarius]|uniref:helix-turn-helix domain-containing protein n=1 Tax=Kineococcus sp. SYSU DK007 TaxID=3383128 RepID=UPI003D7DBE5A